MVLNPERPALAICRQGAEFTALLEALRKIGEQLYGDFAPPSLRLHHTRNRDKRAGYSMISRV